MPLWLWLIVTLILVMILRPQSDYTLEGFTEKNSVISLRAFGVPIRYKEPSLYPSTGPPDMLTMKKFLLYDGYRFQNPLLSPRAVNQRCGIDDGAYPFAFIQRVGAFKHKTSFEGFSGGGGGATTQGTISQLNARDEQDQWLQGQKGDPIEDSIYTLGPRQTMAPLHQEQEVNYKNKEFSWGDIINRFYNPHYYNYDPRMVI